MHTTFVFNFLAAVTEQLSEELAKLNVTPLNDSTLAALQGYCAANGLVQGVYVVHEGDDPRYAGKADNVVDRLGQHLSKLQGRQNIDLAAIGYKALMLERSMSTAANEQLLITMLKASHRGMWNGAGFGPKDPGKNRDTTFPGEFDREHPIRADFALTEIDDVETIASLFAKMKAQLPYVFRYDISSAPPTTLDLSGTVRTSESLLKAAIDAMPPGWHAATLSYGIVVYEGKKDYPWARSVNFSPGS